ncbi:MAG TPA: hypothetical protein V6C65_42060 [Allocoleopsis sp.]
MTNKNARFWYFNRSTFGWVKLTLKPEQKLYFSERFRTEEGFSCVYELYVNTDNRLLRAYSTDSRDCDGRHCSYEYLACALEETQFYPLEYDKLKHWEESSADIKTPRWVDPTKGEKWFLKFWQ